MLLNSKQNINDNFLTPFVLQPYMTEFQVYFTIRKNGSYLNFTVTTSKMCGITYSSASVFSDF